MKIALLSDIHANIAAFETVLKQIEKDRVDLIYIAGDLVGYYYHPSEVIDICMARDDVYCIRGNHDSNFLSGLSDETQMRNLIKKYGSSYALTRDKLNSNQIRWLRNLPSQLETDVDGVTITLAHGSIYSEDEYVYPDQPPADLIKHLSSSQITVLGHTHHPFVWHNNNRILINPGSVGQPRDQSGMASFCYVNLASMAVMPRKLDFPLKRLQKDISKYDPTKKYLIDILKR